MKVPLLEMRGITKIFPGVKALTEVALTCDGGEVHGLIGENGAGKSTLIKILSGIYQPDGGEICLDGERVTLRSPAHAARLGIGVIHQEFDLIPQRTVSQNLFLGREPTMCWGFIDFKTLNERTRHFLDRVRLNVSPEQPVSELSVEQKQLLAIAKALSQDARILVMDEPTAALNGAETVHLLNLVREIRAQGCGVVFISHHMEEVFEISDTVTVLRDGHVVDVRPAADMDEDTAVRLMTGKTRVQKRLSGASPRETIVLDVRGLSHKKYFQDVSFSLREGEIVGLVGLEGQGQRHILRALYGDFCADSGEVLLHGEALPLCKPSDALSKGIVFVPEERKEEGLCLQLDVGQNLALSTLDDRARLGVVRLNREREEVCRTMMAVRLSTADPARIVGTLSGGNQQKVVIAKCLACNPSVLLFSEPTRGIDVGAKEEIYLLIRGMADAGSGILMVSGDISELQLVCDRILVVHKGRVVREFEGEGADREAIMRAMWGLESKEDGSAGHGALPEKEKRGKKEAVR